MRKVHGELGERGDAWLTTHQQLDAATTIAKASDDDVLAIISSFSGTWIDADARVKARAQQSIAMTEAIKRGGELDELVVEWPLTELKGISDERIKKMHEASKYSRSHWDKH